MTQDTPDDRRFLYIFDPDPAKAEAEYVKLVTRLRRFFEWKGCTASSEDLVQETLARGFKKIREGQELTTHPARYFRGIAQNVLFEEWKKRRSESLDLEDPAVIRASSVAPSVETRFELEQALSRLPAADRDLIIKYSQGDKTDRERLRLECGETANALRIRIWRIREELRRLLGGPSA